MEHRPAMEKVSYELVSRLPYPRASNVYIECLLCWYNSCVTKTPTADSDYTLYRTMMARTVLSQSAYCSRVGCSRCYPVVDERCRELRPVIVEAIRTNGTHVANDAVAILLLVSGPPYADIVDALSNATDSFKRSWAAGTVNLSGRPIQPASYVREFMRQCARAMGWSPGSQHWRLSLARCRLFTDTFMARSLSVMILMTHVEGCVWWSIPRELLWCIARHLYLFYCDDIVRT